MVADIREKEESYSDPEDFKDEISDSGTIIICFIEIYFYLILIFLYN